MSHLEPHDAPCQAGLKAQSGERLVRMQHRDALTQADQAQQVHVAEECGEGALKVHGPSVQVVHLQSMHSMCVWERA